VHARPPRRRRHAGQMARELDPGGRSLVAGGGRQFLRRRGSKRPNNGSWTSSPERRSTALLPRSGGAGTGFGQSDPWRARREGEGVGLEKTSPREHRFSPPVL
jgi:hypothetical protein